MERFQWLSHPFAVAAVVGVVVSLLCKPAAANPPMTVSVALETPPTVSLGEPIIGHYTITNALSPDLLCWFSSGNNGCLTAAATVFDKQVPQDQAPSVFAEASQGFIRVSGKDDRGGINTGYFIINGWHETGLHALTLAIHFRYAYAGANDPAYPPDARTKDPVFNDTYKFSASILPTSLRRIRNTSEALRRALLKERDFQRRGILITALFSMPEALVHDCWKELVYDTRTTGLEQAYIAQHLADISSLTSADLLAYQIWTQPSISMYPQTSQEALANMYNNADPALHQHIRDLYAQHGIQVADKIAMPQIID